MATAKNTKPVEPSIVTEEAKKAFQDMLGTIQTSYGTVIGMMKEQFDAHFASLKEEHDKLIEQTKFDFNVSLRNLKAAQTEEIENLKFVHARKIKELEVVYTEKVDSLKVEFENLKKDYSQFASLAEENKSLNHRIEDLNEALEKDKMAILQEAHQRELADFQTSAKITSLEQENGKLRGMLSSKEKEISELTSKFANVGTEITASLERLLGGRQTRDAIEEMKNLITLATSKK